MASEQETVATAVASALQAGKFFVAPPAAWRVEFAPDERLAWEVFRGHLVDPKLTRESIRADVWNVYLDAELPTPAAIISLVHERDASRLHVTRQILVYGAEAYEESPGVILTRDVQKWVRELVATIDSSRVDPETLVAEIEMAVTQAVVGTSRLPITSLESPLPAYSLGQLGYCPARAEFSGREQPWTNPLEYLARALAIHPWGANQAMALETCLRATTGAAAVDVVATLLAAASPAESVPRLFRELFNRVALSPYTDFTRNLAGVIRQWFASGTECRDEAIDTLGYMLRHLCRHLTAFDLTTFHNFGANYPDALFLDELLRTMLDLLAQCPQCARTSSGEPVAVDGRKRRRRRALRQAALLRRHYEGHLVPEVPTSMGESLRVLPADFPRASAAQITDPRARRKRLYEGSPTEGLFDAATRPIFEQSLDDLSEVDELCELGTAVFLARPLGVFKLPGEVDRTPLVAYEAQSRALARRRLDELQTAGWLSPRAAAGCVEQLEALPQHGVPVASLTLTERPGVVSLADALKAAKDFRLVRSTAGSLAELFSAFDLAGLASVAPAAVQWLSSREPKLLVPNATVAGQATLRLLDTQRRCGLELALVHPREGGYHMRDVQELPERIQVVSWSQPDAPGEPLPRPFRGEPVWLMLRQGNSTT